MLNIALTPEAESKLRIAAERAGKSIDAFAAEALEEFLEELEDIRIAEERLRDPQAPLTTEEVKNELGLED